MLRDDPIKGIKNELTATSNKLNFWSDVVDAILTPPVTMIFSHIMLPDVFT